MRRRTRRAGRLATWWRGCRHSSDASMACRERCAPEASFFRRMTKRRPLALPLESTSVRCTCGGSPGRRTRRCCGSRCRAPARPAVGMAPLPRPAPPRPAPRRAALAWPARCCGPALQTIAAAIQPGGHECALHDLAAGPNLFDLNGCEPGEEGGAAFPIAVEAPLGVLSAVLVGLESQGAHWAAGGGCAGPLASSRAVQGSACELAAVLWELRRSPVHVPACSRKERAAARPRRPPARRPGVRRADISHHCARRGLGEHRSLPLPAGALGWASLASPRATSRHLPGTSLAERCLP